MDLDKMPFDKHHCPFTFYVGNEDVNTVKMLETEDATILVEDFSSGEVDIIEQFRISNTLFHLQLEDSFENNIYFDYSGQTHSGTRYLLKLERQPGFFLISYLIPSLLIIFCLTYASFWLDKAAVPARVSIGVTPILMTVNLIARANAGIANISYLTWQSMFFLGILVFTAFGMVEYGAINYTFTFYVTRRKLINELIGKLKKSEAKVRFIQVFHDFTWFWHLEGK